MEKRTIVHRRDFFFLPVLFFLYVWISISPAAICVTSFQVKSSRRIERCTLTNEKRHISFDLYYHFLFSCSYQGETPDGLKGGGTIHSCVHFGNHLYIKCGMPGMLLLMMLTRCDSSVRLCKIPWNPCQVQYRSSLSLYASLLLLKKKMGCYRTSFHREISGVSNRRMSLQQLKR